MKALGITAMLVLLTSAGWAITNGDFEGGANAGWTTLLTSALDSTDVRPGSTGYTSAEVLRVGAGDGYFVQEETGVQAGDTWKVEGWIKVHTGRAVVGWFSNGDAPLGEAAEDTLIFSPTDWQSFSIQHTFTSTSEAGYRRVGIKVTNGDTFLDDITTTKVSTGPTNTPTRTPTRTVTPTRTPTPTFTRTPSSTPTSVPISAVDQGWQRLP